MQQALVGKCWMPMTGEESDQTGDSPSRDKEHLAMVLQCRGRFVRLLLNGLRPSLDRSLARVSVRLFVWFQFGLLGLFGSLDGAGVQLPTKDMVGVGCNVPKVPLFRSLRGGIYYCRGNGFSLVCSSSQHQKKKG